MPLPFLRNAGKYRISSLGRTDPIFHPMIYGTSDKEDWTLEKVWYKVNPSLGHTIDIKKVRNAYLSASNNPAEENIFRQLRFNQWVNQSSERKPGVLIA